VSQVLPYSGVTHAHHRPVENPELGARIDGRTAVRYLRFLRRVRVDRLELPRLVYGRWAPNVPTHPAHLTVSLLNKNSWRWETVREIWPEADPRIAGEGLSQAMTAEEMDGHFARLLGDGGTIGIELDGLECDLLRVECDREHPVWPSHGECNGGPYQVPFGILNPLRAIGEPCESEPDAPPHVPILTTGRIEPKAPEGMNWRRVGESIVYAGRHLSVAFGLRRPVLMHLGWDASGEGRAEKNRLSIRRPRFGDANHGVSGPLLVTPQGDYGTHHWSGHVEIAGNRIAYHAIQPVANVTVDAVFTVEPERIVLELSQSASAAVPVLEAEAWRLAWSLRRGMTGVAAEPTLRPGRSGEVHPPAMFAGDGIGCLGCRLVGSEGGPAWMQVESYRPSYEVAAGFVLGERPENDRCQVVPAGRIAATVELSVDNLQPVREKDGPAAGVGVRRHWASSFSCYRPEWGGFSNHAASVNCHVNQHTPIDVAAFTQRPRNGFDPLSTARFTIGRALMDGGGYGYWRNLYLDSDPVLVCSAGRIWQVSGDATWLRQVEPGLAAAVERMLATIGAEGLVVCRDLSGNSGSHRWSSNAWDVVGFGHLDAYVNAWTYRGLRNGTALLRELDRGDLANLARDAAARLRDNYARWLVNPETGWVIGWRSRDGEIHDYGYLWINGPACAFGLLTPESAKRALGNLESLRDRLGLQSARLGLPFNLLPLRSGDHMLPVMPGYQPTEPTFETYTDGSMSPSAVAFYLRALSIHGFKDRARAMAADLDGGFADDLFSGGAGGGLAEGNEFLSWEGLATGYEGTFGPTMGTLYAVAIEQSLFSPPEPEWWPEGG